MKCKVCSDSFSKPHEYRQHMSYVHGTSHLEDYSDQRVIVQAFHNDVEKFKESDYCKVCGVKSEDTICVLLGDSCNYAGSCTKHHDMVLESLRF
ncbi:MAG: hypothetical protein HOD60_11865 [Candidatus Nitrosopelagicus sp.]|nr:hypothetical protein [Candidatus Nitrosopelagicus sp.]